MTDNLLTLSIVPNRTTPITNVMQGDIGRTIRILLNENEGTPIDLEPTGWDFAICGMKPNQEAFSYTDIFTIEENRLVFQTRENMTDIVGHVKCTLLIFDGFVQIGALPFLMEVKERPLSDSWHYQVGNTLYIQRAANTEKNGNRLYTR